MVGHFVSGDVAGHTAAGLESPASVLQAETIQDELHVFPRPCPAVLWLAGSGHEIGPLVEELHDERDSSGFGSRWPGGWVRSSERVLHAHLKRPALTVDGR